MPDRVPETTPTPEEEIAIKRAFAGLEELSEAWAAEVNLTDMHPNGYPTVREAIDAWQESKR